MMSLETSGDCKIDDHVLPLEFWDLVLEEGNLNKENLHTDLPPIILDLNLIFNSQLRGDGVLNPPVSVEPPTIEQVADPVSHAKVGNSPILLLI